MSLKLNLKPLLQTFVVTSILAASAFVNADKRIVVRW